MNTLIESSVLGNRTTLSFPNDELRADEIKEVVSLLNVFLITRRSEMTSEQAEEISEEIKASWWNSNRDRILNMIRQNG